MDGVISELAHAATQPKATGVFFFLLRAESTIFVSRADVWFTFSFDNRPLRRAIALLIFPSRQACTQKKHTHVIAPKIAFQKKEPLITANGKKK